MKKNNEVFISVDVETAGPVPGKYSLLSIGACEIEDEKQAFFCQLKPTTYDFDPEALKVTGLSLEKLQLDGEDPMLAMGRFRDWINKQVSEGKKPVFVGFNAAFDWSFINYYFHTYLGENPFGFSALDIKSMYMGVAECDWADTRSSVISAKLKPMRTGTHNALDDARFQGELFRLIRNLKNAR